VARFDTVVFDRTPEYQSTTSWLEPSGGRMRPGLPNGSWFRNWVVFVRFPHSLREVVLPMASVTVEPQVRAVPGVEDVRGRRLARVQPLDEAVARAVRAFVDPVGGLVFEGVVQRHRRQQAAEVEPEAEAGVGAGRHLRGTDDLALVVALGKVPDVRVVDQPDAIRQSPGHRVIRQGDGERQVAVEQIDRVELGGGERLRRIVAALEGGVDLGGERRGAKQDTEDHPGGEESTDPAH
jgi:hypothetical protein